MGRDECRDCGEAIAPEWRALGASLCPECLLERVGDKDQASYYVELGGEGGAA